MLNTGYIEDSKAKSRKTVCNGYFPKYPRQMAKQVIMHNTNK